MVIAILIGLVVIALAALGITYFVWRIEQDVPDAKKMFPIGSIVIVGGGLLLLYSLLRRA